METWTGHKDIDMQTFTLPLKSPATLRPTQPVIHKYIYNCTFSHKYIHWDKSTQSQGTCMYTHTHSLHCHEDCSLKSPCSHEVRAWGSRRMGQAPCVVRVWWSE